MATRRKKRDHRNWVIGILAVIVALQAYAIFTDKGRGWFQRISFKKTQEVQPTIKKPLKPTPAAPAEKKQKPAAMIKPAGVKQVPARTPVQGAGAKIAIIIDDWGYNESHCQYLSQIQGPVTVSILPNLAHSVDVAECAYQNKKEVMLHLPLEPHHNLEKYPEGYIIRTSMSRAKVRELLKQALKGVPHAVGINNHMGSKATEDRRLMSIIFEELKKNNLFFVDSFVTNASVCAKLAKEMKIPFTQRDIFLDNRNDRPSIEKQFAQLARVAQARGYAVGIGHDRTLTLQIIKEQTETLRQDGFEIVTINRLINNQ